MAYLQVWTSVEGSLDEDIEFDDTRTGNREYTRWLVALDNEAKAEGFTVEVYEIYHAHDSDAEECECVQYLTDHHPAYTFGPTEEDS